MELLVKFSGKTKENKGELAMWLCINNDEFVNMDKVEAMYIDEWEYKELKLYRIIGMIKDQRVSFGCVKTESDALFQIKNVLTSLKFSPLCHLKVGTFKALLREIVQVTYKLKDSDVEAKLEELYKEEGFYIP